MIEAQDQDGLAQCPGNALFLLPSLFMLFTIHPKARGMWDFQSTARYSSPPKACWTWLAIPDNAGSLSVGNLSSRLVLSSTMTDHWKKESNLYLYDLNNDGDDDIDALKRPLNSGF